MKALFLPDKCEAAGIAITYIKSRDVLVISGWFDHIAGIESTEMSVKDFCEELGIDLKRRRDA